MLDPGNCTVYQDDEKKIPKPTIITNNARTNVPLYPYFVTHEEPIPPVSGYAKNQENEISVAKVFSGLLHHLKMLLSKVLETDRLLSLEIRR